MRAKRATIPQARSKAEAEFELHLKIYKVPGYTTEFKFHPTRKWRFDFAFIHAMLAVEVEGITYDSGRHQRKDGFEKDLEKYEAAMLAGWTVYRCSPAIISSGRAIDVTMKMLEQLCWTTTPEPLK